MFVGDIDVAGVSGRGIAAESPHGVEHRGTKEDLQRKARPGAIAEGRPLMKFKLFLNLSADFLNF